MLVEEIKDRDVRDESTHYRMKSDKCGEVEFSVNLNDDNKREMYAYMWDCPGEGKKFLRELENYASLMKLKLIINNVINPALETILRNAGYEEYYIKLSELDGDVIQCWKKENK